MRYFFQGFSGHDGSGFTDRPANNIQSYLEPQAVANMWYGPGASCHHLPTTWPAGRAAVDEVPVCLTDGGPSGLLKMDNGRIGLGVPGA